jgi:hypothetical protein
MQHFNEFINTQDKIVHLLVAAICEGGIIYTQAINECKQEYGEQTTKDAVATFEHDYKSLIKRFN